MIHLHDIRYVRLGTADLDGAIRYATDVLGLEIAHRSSGCAYFKSDSRDHTLCYFDGDPRNAGDPLLSSIDDEAVRQTLLARREGDPAVYRFDIVLQGDNETLFLDL